MTPSCLLDHALAFRLGNALQNQRQPCTDELRNPTRYARRMVVMKVTAQSDGNHRRHVRRAPRLRVVLTE